MLRKGKLDERYVELDVTDSNVPMVEIFSAAGLEEMEFNVKEVFGNIFPPKKKEETCEDPGGHGIHISRGVATAY